MASWLHYRYWPVEDPHPYANTLVIQQVDKAIFSFRGDLYEFERIDE